MSGHTTCEPFTGTETDIEASLVSIIADVPLSDVQVRIELSPGLIDIGFALSVQAGFVGGTTVTVVWHVAITPPFETVITNVLVAVRFATLRVPLRATAPMPLIEADDVAETAKLLARR